MPCTGLSQLTRAFHSGSACPRYMHTQQTCSVQTVSWSVHQMPGPVVMQSSAHLVRRRPSCSCRRSVRQAVCKAQKQEEQEKEKDMVGGFDVDSPAGFLESEAVGIVFKVGFFLFVSAGVAAILLLARPVIDNTIQAFPYRTSGDGQQGDSSDKSLIPGLDSGPSESIGDSIFD